jgi:RNA polymerase sigma-70 factor (ECF subfamily)
MEDEVALHARLLAGDEAAFHTVYASHAALVLGLAARVTRDRAAAEDIAQEVFTHLWTHPFSFDPARGSLRTWLAVLAHRRAVDWVRREEARRNVRPPAAEPDRGDETAEAAMRSVLSARVRKMLGELPETLRAPVLLAYYGGRTYREVAAELGIPEGTAKTRIRAALHRLAEALAAEAPAAEALVPDAPSGAAFGPEEGGPP